MPGFFNFDSFVDHVAPNHPLLVGGLSRHQSMTRNKIKENGAKKAPQRERKEMNEMIDNRRLKTFLEYDFLRRMTFTRVVLSRHGNALDILYDN